MPGLKLRWRNWPVAMLAVIVILAAGQYFGWFSWGARLNSAQPGMYAVAYDIDGDTIVVDSPSGEETVRFIGADTPETHDPRKPVQCYGPKAAAHTKSLVSGQDVKLVADPLDTNRDRYGRLLRYVYLPDGTLLNEELIRDGYAFYYPYFPFSKKAEFAAAEQAAQAQQLGLWSSCHPIPTDQGGYTSNPLGT